MEMEIDLSISDFLYEASKDGNVVEFMKYSPLSNIQNLEK